MGKGQPAVGEKMHKRLVALPGRQAAEHRRGGGREMVSISWVEVVQAVPRARRRRHQPRGKRARAQPRALQRGLAPPPAAVDGGVGGHRRALEVAPASRQCLSSRVDGVTEQRVRSREHSPNNRVLLLVLL